jgi:hypothetical protein
VDAGLSPDRVLLVARDRPHARGAVLRLPSFRFAGAGRCSLRLCMLGSHLFWTMVTQSDVFIASRSLDRTSSGSMPRRCS